MSRGVPRSARIAAASRVLAGSRRRSRRRGPCPGARRSRGRPSSPRAASCRRPGGSRRCRRSRAPAGPGSGRGSRAGTSASRRRRRPGPHVVAGLRRDDELVAVGTQVVTEDAAEVLLRRSVRRAVVVCEVEMGDAEIEGATHDLAARLERADAPEVLPQPERDRRQREAALAAAVVAHLVVAFTCGDVWHRLHSSRVLWPLPRTYPIDARWESAPLP